LGRADSALTGRKHQKRLKRVRVGRKIVKWHPTNQTTPAQTQHRRTYWRTDLWTNDCTHSRTDAHTRRQNKLLQHGLPNQRQERLLWHPLLNLMQEPRSDRSLSNSSINSNNFYGTDSWTEARTNSGTDAGNNYSHPRAVDKMMKAPTILALTQQPNPMRATTTSGLQNQNYDMTWQTNNKRWKINRNAISRSGRRQTMRKICNLLRAGGGGGGWHPCHYMNLLEVRNARCNARHTGSSSSSSSSSSDVSRIAKCERCLL
jgi:hypothetical protein